MGSGRDESRLRRHQSQRLANGAQLSVRAGKESQLSLDQEDHGAQLRRRLLETQICEDGRDSSQPGLQLAAKEQNKLLI